jgi:hypothetical protein
VGSTSGFAICLDGRVLPVPSGVYVHSRPLSEPIGALGLAAALVTVPMPGVVMVHLTVGAERAAIVLRYLRKLPGRVRARLVVKPPQNVLDDLVHSGVGRLEELGDLYDLPLLLPKLAVLRASRRAVPVDAQGRETVWGDAAAVRLLTRVQAAGRESVIEAVRLVASREAPSMRRLQQWSWQTARTMDELYVRPSTSGVFTAGTVQHAFGAYLARYGHEGGAGGDPASRPQTLDQLRELIGGIFEPVEVPLRLPAGTAVLVSFRQAGSDEDGIAWIFADAQGRMQLEPEADEVTAGTPADVLQWLEAVLADSSTRVLAVDATGAATTLAAMEFAASRVRPRVLNDAEGVQREQKQRKLEERADPNPAMNGSPGGGALDVVFDALQRADERALARVLGRLMGVLEELGRAWGSVYGVDLGRPLPVEWYAFVAAVRQAGHDHLIDPTDRMSVIRVVSSFDLARTAMFEQVPQVILPTLLEVTGEALDLDLPRDRVDVDLGPGGHAEDLHVRVLLMPDGRRVHDQDGIDFDPLLTGRAEDERMLLISLAEDDDEFVFTMEPDPIAAAADRDQLRLSPVAYTNYTQWKIDYDKYRADSQNILEPVASTAVLIQWVKEFGNRSKKPHVTGLSHWQLRAFLQAHQMDEHQYVFALNSAGRAIDIQRKAPPQEHDSDASAMETERPKKRRKRAARPLDTKDLDRFREELLRYRTHTESRDDPTQADSYPAPTEVPLKAVTAALALGQLLNDDGTPGRPKRVVSDLRRSDAEAFLVHEGIDPSTAQMTTGPRARVKHIGLENFTFLPSGGRAVADLAVEDLAAEDLAEQTPPGLRLSPVVYTTYGHWRSDHDKYQADPENHLEPVAGPTIVTQWLKMHERLATTPPIMYISWEKLGDFAGAHGIDRNNYVIEKNGSYQAVNVKRVTSLPGQEDDASTRATPNWKPKRKRIKPEDQYGEDLDNFRHQVGVYFSPLRAHEAAEAGSEEDQLPLGEASLEVPRKAVSAALALGLLLDDSGKPGRRFRLPSKLRRPDALAFLAYFDIDPAPADIEIVHNFVSSIRLSNVRFLTSGPPAAPARPSGPPAAPATPSGQPEGSALDPDGEVVGQAGVTPGVPLPLDSDSQTNVIDPALLGDSVMDDRPAAPDQGAAGVVDEDEVLQWFSLAGQEYSLPADDVEEPTSGADRVDAEMVDRDLFRVEMPDRVLGSVKAGLVLLSRVPESQLRGLAGELRSELERLGDLASLQLGEKAPGTGWRGALTTEVGGGGAALNSLSGVPIDSVWEQVSGLLAEYDFAREQTIGVTRAEVGVGGLGEILPSVKDLVSGVRNGRQQRLEALFAPQDRAWVDGVLALGQVSEKQRTQVAGWTAGMVRPVVLMGPVGEADRQVMVDDVLRVLRRAAYAGVQPVVHVVQGAQFPGLGKALESVRDDLKVVTIEPVTAGLHDGWAVIAADGTQVATAAGVDAQLFEMADQLPFIGTRHELAPVLRDWLAITEPSAIADYLREHVAQISAPALIWRLNQLPVEDAGLHRMILRLLQHSGGPAETFAVDYLTVKRSLHERKEWNDQLIQLLDLRHPEDITRTGVQGLTVDEMLVLAANTRDDVPGEVNFSRGLATVFTALAKVLLMSQDKAAGPITTTAEWRSLLKSVATCNVSPVARQILIYQLDTLRYRLSDLRRVAHAALVRLMTDAIGDCGTAEA